MDNESNHKWRITNNYIGEIFIAPTPIADRIHFMFTGYRIQSLLIFYYGERDERLSRLFGYS